MLKWIHSIHTTFRISKTFKRSISFALLVFVLGSVFFSTGLQAFADSGERTEDVDISAQVMAVGWKNEHHDLQYVSANSANNTWNVQSNEEYTYITINFNVRSTFNNSTDIERFYTGESYAWFNIDFSYNYNMSYPISDINPVLVSWKSGNTTDKVTYNAVYHYVTDIETNYKNVRYRVNIGLGQVFNDSVRLPAELNDTFEVTFLVVRRTSVTRYFDSTIGVSIYPSSLQDNWVSYYSERAYLDSIDEKLDALDLVVNDYSGVSDNVNSAASSAAAAEAAADSAISSALPSADAQLSSISAFDYNSIATGNTTALSFWKSLGDWLLSNSNLVGIGALLIGCLFIGFVVYLLRL